MNKKHVSGVTAAPAPSTDPLDRAKEIRERVDALDAEREALWQEYLRILPAGQIDADDLAWAAGKDGVDSPDGANR